MKKTDLYKNERLKVVAQMKHAAGQRSATADGAAPDRKEQRRLDQAAAADVHEDRARLHAGEGAVGAQHDRAQVLIVADTAEHDLLAGRGLAELEGHWQEAKARIRAEAAGEP